MSAPEDLKVEKALRTIHGQLERLDARAAALGRRVTERPRDLPELVEKLARQALEMATTRRALGLLDRRRNLALWLNHVDEMATSPDLQPEERTQYARVRALVALST